MMSSGGHMMSRGHMFHEVECGTQEVERSRADSSEEESAIEWRLEYRGVE